MSYVYTPLESTQASVRLLYLHPTRRSRKIQCSLRAINLGHTDIPDYWALSYTWGEGHCCSIELDGHEKHIGENLYNALNRLRAKETTRCIWVDALCIDQDNDAERSHQVARMQDIFMNAEKVIVWLGEESEDSAVAMEYLRTQHLSPRTI